MDWLRAQRPELVPRYEELYRRGAYAPREERERLAGMVRRRGSRRQRFWRRARLGREQAEDALGIGFAPGCAVLSTSGPRPASQGRRRA